MFIRKLICSYETTQSLNFSKTTACQNLTMTFLQSASNKELMYLIRNDVSLEVYNKALDIDEHHIKSLFLISQKPLQVRT